MENLTEFRLHGRGGQGIVIAAAVFAEAVFREGLYARAFSLFGAERRGAPVTAFVRAGSDRLMPRCRIYQPDYIAVFDATINSSMILEGVNDGAVMLVNTADAAENSSLHKFTGENGCRVFQIDAAAIAWRHSLTIGSIPAVNTVMVGALARISGLATLESVLAAVEKRVAARREDNLKAAAEGYQQVREVARVG